MHGQTYKFEKLKQGRGLRPELLVAQKAMDHQILWTSREYMHLSNIIGIGTEISVTNSNIIGIGDEISVTNSIHTQWLAICMTRILWKTGTQVSIGHGLLMANIINKQWAVQQAKDHQGIQRDCPSIYNKQRGQARLNNNSIYESGIFSDLWVVIDHTRANKHRIGAVH